MVFNQSHVYWTFGWSVTGAATERGQIGLRASTPGTPPTLTTVENVGDAFATFWISSAAKISSVFRFDTVKAALIQPNGDYDPGFDPVVENRSSVGGAVPTTTAVYPLQVAHTLQLVTDRTSGPAHAGRVYLPPIAAALSTSTFKWSLSDVDARAAAFATFVTAMNTEMGSEAVLVMSQKGTGASRAVEGIRADDRADIQRRRARQQTYTWGSVSSVS